MGEATRFIVC